MSPAATVLGRDMDLVFMTITGICIFLAAAIVVVMLYFTYRYSCKRCLTSSEVKASPTLELSFLGGSVALVLAMFVLGWDGYEAMYSKAPDDALEVKTRGQMWQWTFEYPNGKESQELYVPLNKAVKTDLISRDVNHSFFIPAFRVKEDVIPGQANYTWFMATELGTFDIECAEFCGQRHAYMLSKVHVVPEDEFNAWLTAVDRVAAAEPKGLQLVKGKGCIACHSLDGTAVVGPSFKGLYGKTETVVTGGAERAITVNEGYIATSILEPMADVVKGFSPIMPSFKGQLSDEEIAEIVNYLKELN